MQVNKINSNTNNNINFKARLKVRIEEGFINSLKKYDSLLSARFAERTSNAITMLADNIGFIGKDTDIVTLTAKADKYSGQGFLELLYNGRKDPDISDITLHSAYNPKLNIRVALYTLIGKHPSEKRVGALNINTPSEASFAIIEGNRLIKHSLGSNYTMASVTTPKEEIDNLRCMNISA